MRTLGLLTVAVIILRYSLFTWATEFLIDEKLPQRINLGDKGFFQRKVVVAVADCGFDTHHPYLKPYLREGYNGITNTPDIHARVNTTISDSTYGQTDDHATHVASTIIQIAAGCIEVVPCRVGSHFKNVLTYLTTRDDIQIINISMAIYLEDAVERDLLIKLAQQGKIIVKSAGNSGVAIDQSKDKNLIGLSQHPDVQGKFIFVGKTETIDGREVLVYPSNFAGSARDYFIGAPGDIDSAVPLDNSPDGHAKNVGTSMSAAVVSGALARLMAEYPQASIGEIISSIFHSATKGYGDEIFDAHVYGHGVLNFLAARKLLSDKFESSLSISLINVKVLPPSIFARQRDLRKTVDQFESSLHDFDQLQDMDAMRKVAAAYKHLYKLKITFFDEKQRTIEKEIKLRDRILQNSEQKHIKDLRKAASAYKRLFTLNKDPGTAKYQINLRAAILHHPDYQSNISDIKKAFWAYRDIFEVLCLRLEKIQVKEEELRLRKMLWAKPNYKIWLIDWQCIAGVYRDLYILYDDDHQRQEVLREEVKSREEILEHAGVHTNLSDLRKAILAYRDYYMILKKPEEKLIILKKASKLWEIILTHTAHNNGAIDIKEAAWIQEQLKFIKETLPESQDITVNVEPTFQPSTIPPVSSDPKSEEEKLQPSYIIRIWRRFIQCGYSWFPRLFSTFCSFNDYYYEPIRPNQ